MAIPVKKNQLNEDFFKRIMQKGTLGHAYLLEGPAGSGKKKFSVWLAQAIFCINKDENENPCLECYQCQRINDRQHPDIIEIKVDGAAIKVDQIRDLIMRLSKTSMEDDGQLVIIEEADKMTTGAANALLKLLEEPEEKTILLLLTTAKNRILPTIISRCQEIKFKPLSQQECYSQLVEKKIPDHSARILSYITQDIQEAQNFYEDTDFQSILSKVVSYYDYLSQKNEMALAYLQSDLMPVVNNRETQELAWEILTSIYRIELKENINSNQSLQVDDYLQYIKGKDLSLVLEGLKMFRAYVPFQSSMEYLTLKILKSSE
ncbi:MAG: DNA polymerase III subunit delta' [Atopococcus tabaci]|uniref:DNA polymerase III subunit delta n=1 Tax=Atopococcus tabaci TaxID=269774 RepID=A0AA43ZSZ5_9LACT|nr:DNA polymerase III subunit delta' [Atopococcus tabaci]